ncbi:MAG TPA: YHYH protein [Alphaproteobacteria bacterium]|nr:YHYH protein [Alphaproteobacteria bacterium]
MKIHIRPFATFESSLILLSFACVCFSLAVPAVAADPRTNCWLVTYSGQYARVYTNSTMQQDGTALTTWANSSFAQSLPAYCGVQEVYSSSNWVYVRSTGLASYTMGPWYLNSAHTQLFPNLPTNQQVLYRFPRTNNVPATKTENGGGQIGIFVDGVAMYNSWDAYTWDPTNQMNEQNITGYWNRDAYVNEGVTFDPGNAHQQQSGVYHYHADPVGLRYLLGDHVDYNPATKIFSEDTNVPTKHSPILAWTADGYPLYGPYGYSNATNANSGLRRMISGYVLRNGQYGTSNLTLTGRTTIPQWAVRLYNVASNQPGPSVSSAYPLDDYMEDNDYLGDLINTNTGTNYQQGVDFDLDQYNGRWCVTPEFPAGTYAYFVAINSNGIPVFPYDIGRGFYGSPIGGGVSTISETVATNFLGYTNLSSELEPPTVKTGSITLTWSALEGGSYEVQSTTNLGNASWTTLASSVSPYEITGAYTNQASSSRNFYRVGRTAIAPYQGAGTTVFSTTSFAPGGSANPGQTVTVTITLPSSPPWPPANAPISSVTLTNTASNTSITGSSISDSTQGTVVVTFVIPSNAPAGSQNIVVVFQPAPTYTLQNTFTIN